MKVGLIFLPMWDHGRPPLGINSVAQALRDAGHDVKLYDFNLTINQKFYKKRFFWQRTPKKNYWEAKLNPLEFKNSFFIKPTS